MPAWLRMVKRERLATSDGMSAARMPSSALVRFWTWLLMTLTADCRRLMPAPMEPRMPATLAMAVSMWVKAVCAATVDVGVGGYVGGAAVVSDSGGSNRADG